MPAASGDQQVPRSEEVFISYSRKDKEFVRRLDEALKRRDREAWVDWEGIPPGDTWEKTIYGAIEATHTFIFVLTPDSIASEVCGREIAHAAANNKHLVPIVHRDVAADQVPKSLGELNWIFFREGDDFEEATGKLISALDTDLDWVRVHTRLLTRAIEWDANSRNNSFVLRGEDLRSAERWLAEAGAQKERQPTAVQTEYIITSRKNAARRQRIVLGAVTLGAVIALVLAVIAWMQRTRALTQEQAANKNAREARQAEQRANTSAQTAKRTSVQADSDLAVMYQRGADLIDPKTLAHLARALRTLPEAHLPRQYLVSLLRDRLWHLPLTDPLRHEAAVGAASFSRDGTRIVTASSDKTARVWDAKSGKPVGEPIRHRAAVNAANFSADGQRIVTTSQETAQVWDSASGKSVGAPIHHPKKLASAVFNADGSRILTTTIAGRSRLWDATTGQPVSESLEHAKFSTDGKCVLSVTSDGGVQLWDSNRGTPWGEPLHETEVTAASLSPDGARIVTVFKKTARLWDARTGKPQGSPMLYEKDDVWLVQFNTDGSAIVTGGIFGTARIWNAQTCQPIGEPMKHSGSVNALSYNADGTRIFTHHLGGDACLWDAKSGKRVGEVMRHDVDQHAPVFSPDGSRLLTISRELHTARVWEAKSGKPLGEPLRHEAGVVAAGFSADSARVVTASSDHTARVWNVSFARPPPIVLRQTEKGTSDKMESAVFSPDGTQIVTTDNHIAHIWDTKTGLPMGDPLRHNGDVFAPTFSTDGTRIATASFDHTARIWDAESGRPLSDPLKHAAEVSTAAFSIDGTRIVTASMDKTARIWDAKSGQQLGKPLQHDKWVLSGRFSADGTKILTVSDKTARIWDAKTFEIAGKPMRATGEMHDALFNADGSRVLTLGSKEAQLWDAATGAPIAAPLRGLAKDAGFSVDGTRVLAASAEHKALIWDANDGQPLRESPRSTTQAEGFSADGALIVTDSVGREEARIWDAATGKPVSEPLPYEVQILSASFNRDGTRVVTTANDQAAQIWDVAVDVKAVLPPWVSSLAEALGGERLDDDGRIVPPEKSIFELRSELLALKGDDFWSRLGRWFFMRGPERTISPDSHVTVGELPPVRSPPPPTPEPEAFGSKGRSHKDTYKKAAQAKKSTVSSAL